MKVKNELLEAFHKLLTTQIPIMSGYDAEREIIIKIRYILENCVIIPKDNIEKQSLNKMFEENVADFKKTTYQKRISFVSEMHFNQIEKPFLEIGEINTKLLENLCDYMERDIKNDEVVK